MDDVAITKMELSDFYKIYENLQTDFDEFWTPSILKEELENKNSSYFVLRKDETIVGFGGFWVSVDDVHLTNIVIKKGYRSAGLGSYLLEHIINEAKTTGKQSLTLEVNEENEPAKKLYLKYGFKILGIRKKYYNNKDNAVIMTLFFK